MAPTWVNILLTIVSLMMMGMLVALFFWLLDGWVSPGFLFILSAIGIAFLFTIFGWILLIGLGVISVAVAGIFMGSESS